MNDIQNIIFQLTQEAFIDRVRSSVVANSQAAQLEAIAKELMASKDAQPSLLTRKFVELKVPPKEVKRITALFVQNGVLSRFEAELIFIQTLFQTRNDRPWANIQAVCSSMHPAMQERIFSKALVEFRMGTVDQEYLKFLLQLQFPIDFNLLHEGSAKLLLSLGLPPEKFLSSMNFFLVALALREGASITNYREDRFSFIWMQPEADILERLKEVSGYDFNRCRTSKGELFHPLILQAVWFQDRRTFTYLASHPSINLNHPVPIGARVVSMVLDVQENQQSLPIDWCIEVLEYLRQNQGNLDLETPLLTALLKGHVTLVRTLLRSGADANVLDDKNSGCWHYAFGTRNAGVKTELVQCLLSHRPQPSAVDYAIQENEEDIRFLIGNKLEINCVNQQGKTLLHVACTKGWVRCVDLLLAQGVEVNGVDKLGKSPIAYAFSKGHVEILFKLLATGRIAAVDVFPEEPNEETWSHSLLKLVLQHRRYDLFNQMLKGGAAFSHLVLPTVDPDLRHYLSQNPAVTEHVPQEQRSHALDYLCSPQGRMALLKFLQSLGGNATGKGKEPFSLLVSAIRTQDPAFIRDVLNEHAIDVNDGGLIGCTPLMGMCIDCIPPELMEEWIQLMELLLEKGAKINLAFPDGSTAIKVAVVKFTGDYHRLKFLLARGADVNMQTNEGFCPLYLAENEGLCLFLLEHRANPHVRNEFNQPTLLPKIRAKNWKAPLKHILKEFPDLVKRIDTVETLDDRFKEFLNPDFLLTCPDIQQGKNPLEVSYLLTQTLGPVSERLTREQYRRYVLELVKKQCPKPFNFRCRFLMELLYTIDSSYLRKGKAATEISPAQKIDLIALVSRFDEIVFDEKKKPGHRSPQTVHDEEDGVPVLRTPKYLRDMLGRLISFVNQRKSYVGTPNPKKEPKEFKKFYDNLENALWHLTHYFGTLQDVDIRKNCLIELAIAAGKCGTRWLGESHRQCVTYVLKQGVETLEDQIYGELRKFRHGVLNSLPDTQNIHTQSALMRAIGITEGLPGAELFDVQDPTIGTTLDVLVKESTDRYMGKTRYAPELERVLSAFLNEKYKNPEEKDVVVDWFKDHVPEQWKAQEYQSLLQKALELEKQGEPRGRIAQFLREKGVLLREIQSPSNAIQKGRELNGERIRQQFREFRSAMEQGGKASQDQLRAILEQHGILFKDGNQLVVAEALKMAEEYEIDQNSDIHNLYEQEFRLIETREEISNYLRIRGIYLEPIQTVKQAIEEQRRLDYIDEEFWDMETNEINLGAKIHMLESLGVIRETIHPGLFQEQCQQLKEEKS